MKISKETTTGAAKKDQSEAKKHLLDKNTWFFPCLIIFLYFFANQHLAAKISRTKSNYALCERPALFIFKGFAWAFGNIRKETFGSGRWCVWWIEFSMFIFDCVIAKLIELLAIENRKISTPLHFVRIGLKLRRFLSVAFRIILFASCKLFDGESFLE